MKYWIIGVIAILVGVFYFIHQSNKADAERLKQAQIAYEQKISQEKAAEVQVQKDSIQKEQIQDESRKENNSIKNSNEIATSNPQPKHKYSDSEWMGICKSVSNTARTIMNRRQNGASMSDMMDGVMNTDTPMEIKEIIKPFVIAAYEKPRFSTPEYMLKAEVDFENEAYLTCMHARRH